MLNASDTGRKRRPHIEQFSNFTPDMPDLESTGLTFLQNALPLSTGRYGPARSPVVESQNTLKNLADIDRVSGTIGSFRDLENGNVTLFAGGANPGAGLVQLFAYDEPTRLWRNVTRASGPYNFSVSRACRFAQHGSDMFATVGRSAPIQAMAVGTEERFADVTDAPRATDIAVVREFMVAINFTLNGQNFPDFVMWSAQPNPRSWPEPGTAAAQAVNSGLAQIPGGGRLQRILPGVGGADAIIIAETRIWRMTFIGRPAIWQFDVAAYDQGTSVPGSVAATNEIVVYMGRDGMQVFDGAQSTPIADGQISETWLEDNRFRVQTSSVNGFQNAIAAAIDAERKIYFVSYRTDRGEAEAEILTNLGEPILTDQDEPLLTVETEAGNNAMWAYNYRSRMWGHSFVETDALGLVETERTALDTPRLVSIGPDTALSLLTGDELEAVFEGPERVAKNGMSDTVFSVLPGTDSADVHCYAKIRNGLGSDPIKTQERRVDGDGYAALGEVGVSARYWRIGMRIPAGGGWTFALGFQAILGDHGQGPLRP